MPIEIARVCKKHIPETKDPSSDSEARQDCSHPRKLRNNKQLTSMSLVLKQLKENNEPKVNYCTALYDSIPPI